MSRDLKGWNQAKEESLKRDCYRCVITDLGEELTPLETHHIIPYRICKSHDIDNLITLSKLVHSVVHRKCKIHGVKKNIMTSLDKKCLIKRYREYLENIDNMECMIMFIEYLDSRPCYCKEYKRDLGYISKYIHLIYERGFNVYLNLYFKANGEVVLSYEVVKKGV